MMWTFPQDRSARIEPTYASRTGSRGMRADGAGSIFAAATMAVCADFDDPSPDDLSVSDAHPSKDAPRTANKPLVEYLKLIAYLLVDRSVGRSVRRVQPPVTVTGW